MAQKQNPLNEELTALLLTRYRKVLLEQKDTRGNQILTPEQADTIISKMDMDDIRWRYSEHDIVLQVYADVDTRPYRTFYPEDIENFRNEYLKALDVKVQPWEKEAVEYLRSQFETRYTDEVIVGMLKDVYTPIYAIAKDFTSL